MIIYILENRINKNKIKMYYNIFFQIFFKKFILVISIEIITFLNLRYKEKNLDFLMKKLKKKIIL